MIIFKSTLTTFEASFIFWGSCGSFKNWLELKIKPPLADLALLNPWNTLYQSNYLVLFWFRFSQDCGKANSILKQKKITSMSTCTIMRLFYNKLCLQKCLSDFSRKLRFCQFNIKSMCSWVAFLNLVHCF